jgi:hypothetical protein
MPDNEVHQAHKLRHEKNKRENAESQKRVGKNLAANVPVN